MSATLHLAQTLIARPSITPDDQHCQAFIIERLQALGFSCETIKAGDVTNLWAVRQGRAGQNGKLLVLAGHTDVVPPGPLEQWISPPFVPTVRDGNLYGRGAADMKTSLAAFIVATEEFVAMHPAHQGSLALLITSDEEGPATQGTLKVVEMLRARGQRLDYCIVGEPSSTKVLGDTIKNGRRGSLSGTLTVKGIQGHIAYPHLACNPIHLLAPAIDALAKHTWDHGNAYFPPTTWQASNLHAGTGANNVIPGHAILHFNLRFSTVHTVETLQQQVVAILHAQGLRQDHDYDLAWRVSGQPFLTAPGALCTALSAAIHAETDITAELSTAGGTSDGRFIASICEQVVEFGPLNASIHQLNEYVALADIEPLKNIYRRAITTLIANAL